METKDALAAFSALAQETRLAVFRLLVEAGPEGLSAGEISDELEIPPATLSFHLKELSAAELVSSERFSRSIVYAANFTTMQEVVRYLTENCCGRSTKASACATTKSRTKSARSRSHEKTARQPQR